MTDAAYTHGMKFLAGMSLSFSAAASIKLLEDRDMLPGNLEYSSYQGPLYASVSGAATDPEVRSGRFYEALGDYPGFLAGAAAGTYLAEKTFEKLHRSELEESYRENDLEGLWEDVREDLDDSL